jgi:hypothetical protein
MDPDNQDSVPLLPASQSAEQFRTRAPLFQGYQLAEPLDPVPSSLQGYQIPEPVAAQGNQVTESEIQPCPSLQTHLVNDPIQVWLPYEKPDHSQIEMQPWSSKKSDRIKVRVERMRECDNPADVDIECSKDHWSELTSASSGDEEGESNREVFERLKKDPRFAQFFGSDLSQLKLGRKLAEGGQAEIFEAVLPRTSQDKTTYAVKVFKRGYTLRHLQRQWPQGMLRSSAGFRLTGALRIEGGLVFDDDRFGFVVPRYWGDLRTLMDMRLAQGYNRRNIGPFGTVDAVNILHRIALGMKGLHNQGILHRDLKAANVLIFLPNKIKPTATTLSFHNASSTVVSVADYECSVGVAGTGFWRAPEILQQLKDGNPVQFSAAADVYSFGMVCYEILTGCMPFEGQAWADYDYVLLQDNRPKLWHFGLPSWTEDLIQRCWENDPSKRPTFDTLEAELEQMKLQTVHFYSEILWSVYRGVGDVVRNNKLRFLSVSVLVSLLFILYLHILVQVKH